MCDFVECIAVIKQDKTHTLAKIGIQVSTAAELPTLGTVFGKYKMGKGSIAQIIQANEPTFVTIDEDGTWYPEQSDSSASSLNASLSAPKSIGGEREEITEEPVIEKSGLYPDEPEQTEPEQIEKVKIDEPQDGGEE